MSAATGSRRAGLRSQKGNKPETETGATSSSTIANSNSSTTVTVPQKRQPQPRRVGRNQQPDATSNVATRPQPQQPDNNLQRRDDQPEPLAISSQQPQDIDRSQPPGAQQENGLPLLQQEGSPKHGSLGLELDGGRAQLMGAAVSTQAEDGNLQLSTTYDYVQYMDRSAIDGEASFVPPSSPPASAAVNATALEPVMETPTPSANQAAAAICPIDRQEMASPPPTLNSPPEPVPELLPKLADISATSAPPAAPVATAIVLSAAAASASASNPKDHACPATTTPPAAPASSATPAVPAVPTSPASPACPAAAILPEASLTTALVEPTSASSATEQDTATLQQDVARNLAPMSLASTTLDQLLVTMQLMERQQPPVTADNMFVQTQPSIMAFEYPGNILQRVKERLQQVEGEGAVHGASDRGRPSSDEAADLALFSETLGQLWSFLKLRYGTTATRVIEELPPDIREAAATPKGAPTQVWNAWQMVCRSLHKDWDIPRVKAEWEKLKAQLQHTDLWPTTTKILLSQALFLSGASSGAANPPTPEHATMLRHRHFNEYAQAELQEIRRLQCYDIEKVSFLISRHMDDGVQYARVLHDNPTIISYFDMDARPGAQRKAVDLQIHLKNVESMRRSFLQNCTLQQAGIPNNIPIYLDPPAHYVPIAVAEDRQTLGQLRVQHAQSDHGLQQYGLQALPRGYPPQTVLPSSSIGLSSPLRQQQPTYQPVTQQGQLLLQPSSSLQRSQLQLQPPSSLQLSSIHAGIFDSPPRWTTVSHLNTTNQSAKEVDDALLFQSPLQEDDTRVVDNMLLDQLQPMDGNNDMLLDEVAVELQLPPYYQLPEQVQNVVPADEFIELPFRSSIAYHWTWETLAAANRGDVRKLLVTEVFNYLGSHGIVTNSKSPKQVNEYLITLPVQHGLRWHGWPVLRGSAPVWQGFGGLQQFPAKSLGNMPADQTRDVLWALYRGHLKLVPLPAKGYGNGEWIVRCRVQPQPRSTHLYEEQFIDLEYYDAEKASCRTLKETQGTASRSMDPFIKEKITENGDINNQDVIELDSDNEVAAMSRRSPRINAAAASKRGATDAPEEQQQTKRRKTTTTTRHESAPPTPTPQRKKPRTIVEVVIEQPRSLYKTSKKNTGNNMQATAAVSATKTVQGAATSSSTRPAKEPTQKQPRKHQQQRAFQSQLPVDNVQHLQHDDELQPNTIIKPEEIGPVMEHLRFVDLTADDVAALSDEELVAAPLDTLQAAFAVWEPETSSNVLQRLQRARQAKEEHALAQAKQQQRKALSEQLAALMGN